MHRRRVPFGVVRTCRSWLHLILPCSILLLVAVFKFGTYSEGLSHPVVEEEVYPGPNIARHEYDAITHGSCSFLHGKRSNIACAYLSRLFPSKRRIPVPTLEELHLYRPRYNEFMPLCFLTIPGAGTRNVQYIFEESAKTGIHYDSTEGRRAYATPSLSYMNRTTMVVLLWLKRQFGDSAKLLLHEHDLVDGNSLHLPVNSILSSEMLSEHHWPSGHFLNSSRGYYAAVHQNTYGIGVFQTRKGTFHRMETTGFDDAGGENIGSLFEHQGELYLSVRVNLRYHLRSMGGHGWRNPGIYKLIFDDGNTSFSNSIPRTSDGSKVHGSLSVQHSDDIQCCVACGGCFEDKNFGNRCSVNADEWWSCLARPPNASERGWSLRKNRKCQRTAMRDISPAGCDFSTYYECVHDCRSRGEKYHSAVSNIGGGLIGLIGTRVDNSLSFCRLGNKSLKFFCSQRPLLFSTNSKPTHPVMSAIVETRNKLTFLEMVTVDRFAQEPSKPITIAHSWQRNRFCLLSQKDPSLAGSVTVRVATRGAISVVFTSLSAESTCAQTCGAERTKQNIEMVIDGSRKNMSATSTEFIDDALSGDQRCMCIKHFVLEDLCIHGCHIKIIIEGVVVHGLVQVREHDL